jgi:ABC-2 type transport system ATP-binding protein
MAIQIENLTKVYQKDAPPALEGLTLEIGRGTFGLLGPNGAGKTTLIRILATQMLPTSGQVTVEGHDLVTQREAVRRRLGYLPQHFGAYPQLTAGEFLDYRARLAGIHGRSDRRDRVAESLADVGLTEVRDRRSGTFSGGMMRRLGIAQAILADPDFLVVDEPTVGLDPEERIRFRAILGRLSTNRAILISTHIVGDISSTCEEIAVLAPRKLVFTGRPEDFIKSAEGGVWESRVDDSGFVTVSEQFQVVNVSSEGNEMDVRFVGTGEPPEGAKEVPPNLEDAYVFRMGALLEEEG